MFGEFPPSEFKTFDNDNPRPTEVLIQIVIHADGTVEQTV